MRKYVTGAVAGFILAFSMSAHAEGVINLIGKQVQGLFPVTVNGIKIDDAIVVDNKTYLPVRSFGESIGYDVNFTGDNQVVLQAKQTSSIPTSIERIPDIETYKYEIQQAEQNIKFYKFKIENEPNHPQVNNWKNALQQVQDHKSKMEAEKNVNYPGQ